MNNDQLVLKLETLVREIFYSEGTGHDWFHIDRVRRNAVEIGKVEKADLFLVECGALLHDIADHKFHGGDITAGPRKARQILEDFNIPEEIIYRIVNIVNEVSFKGAKVNTPCSSIESAVVQDADRLDAIGAIGIARAFAYGGSIGQPLFQPDKSPQMHTSFSDYSNSEGNTVNHFYEKLLLLKDRMNTPSGKAMAKERHHYMLQFLDQFYLEWGTVPREN